MNDETTKEVNKRAALRWYEEVWNNQNLDAINELVHPDYSSPEAPPWRKPGIEGLREFMQDQHRVFPDARMQVEDIIAEGDKVVVKFRGTATHKGDLNGPTGLVRATNKKVALKGIAISRMKDGKRIESWMETDNMGLMQQLGALRIAE